MKISRQREIAKPVAYWIITAGCVLAAVTVMAPLPTGSYKLSGTFFLLGITPYIVYGSFTETLKCCPLIGAGTVLLLADLVARFGAQIIHTNHASAMPALYLSLILTLLVIPAGAAVGKLAAKFRPFKVPG